MPPLSRGLRLPPTLRSLLFTPPQRYLNTTVTSGRDRFLRVSEEVQDAVSAGKPVVALETTIYTHGNQTPPLPTAWLR